MVLGVFAYFSDKKKLRSPFIFAAQLINLIGYIINITDAPSGVKYFGTFWCVVGGYTAGTGPIIWWVTIRDSVCYNNRPMLFLT